MVQFFRERSVAQFMARLRYARISPRKLRLVADQIRGQKARVARAILKSLPQRGAPILYKLLDSAQANAQFLIENRNLDLDTDELVIQELQVDPGVILRRWRAGTMGRGMPIRKRTSHIRLVLEGRQPKKKRERSKAAPAKREKIATKIEKKTPTSSPPGAKEEKEKSGKGKS